MAVCGDLGGHRGQADQIRALRHYALAGFYARRDFDNAALLSADIDWPAGEGFAFALHEYNRPSAVVD
jgi:hypothetical protein